jgi:hypothetical protein
VNIVTGRIVGFTRDKRRGFTGGWPASVLLMRYGNRPTGLWLRLGDRAWWVCVVPSLSRTRRP